MTIDELCDEAHKAAVEKGFYDNGVRNPLELLMLITSELSEACEALRNDNPMSEKIPKFTLLEEELADAVIRIADMAKYQFCKLEEAIIAKMEYNKTRSHRHGGKKY